MIEVTADDNRGVCYNYGGDCCNFGGGCCNFVVFASIGMVIAVFAKNRGPEFEIFFKNSKKVLFSHF